MTRTAFVALAIVPIALAAAGCGTLANMQPADKEVKDAPRAGRVYGGVERDVRWAHDCFDKPSDKDSGPSSVVQGAKGAYYLGVDLPCSFVCDTLTLPLTLLVALGEEEDSLQICGQPGCGLASH